MKLTFQVRRNIVERKIPPNNVKYFPVHYIVYISIPMQPIEYF